RQSCGAGVARGPAADINRRAVSCRHVGDVENILYAERHAPEQSVLRCFVGPARLGQRRIRGEVAPRAHHRLAVGNPLEAAPDFPAPPLRAGNYSAEIVAGPRGPVAVYRFAFAGRVGRRLLVLKLDHYGDFLIGLPALKRLREAFPTDHITLVCGSWNAELARRLGVADELRAYDFFPENGAL